MPPSRPALAEAAAGLAASDPVMAGLVAEHGPPTMGTRRRRGTNRFEDLAASIAYQQLAGAAAAAIWGRVRASVDGPFTPEAVAALGPDPLRAAGLSASKAASVLDLATKVVDGDVRLTRIGRFDDEAVITELVQVRGIGRWTAEMFLMFTLHRLDVWPVGDFGVRAGYARAYGLDDLPKPKELMVRGEVFRPWRSVAAWYCWRAADTVTPG